MKMSIVIRFGYRTMSGTFLKRSRTRITDKFMSVFNGVTSPRVF